MKNQRKYMNSINIPLHKRLAYMLPPLTDEQRERLVKSLLTESCQEPLIVYKGVIMEK